MGPYVLLVLKPECPSIFLPFNLRSRSNQRRYGLYIYCWVPLRRYAVTCRHRGRSWFLTWPSRQRAGIRIQVHGWSRTGPGEKPLGQLKGLDVLRFHIRRGTAGGLASEPVWYCTFRDRLFRQLIVQPRRLGPVDIGQRLFGRRMAPKASHERRPFDHTLLLRDVFRNLIVHPALATNTDHMCLGGDSIDRFSINPDYEVHRSLSFVIRVPLWESYYRADLSDPIGGYVVRNSPTLSQSL